MNKLFSRALVGVLAIAMATGSSYGATGVGTQVGIAQTSSKEAKLYEEGQAIVLYKPSSGEVSAKSVDDDCEVADTLEFVTGDNDAATSQDSASDSDSKEPEFSVESLPEGTKLKYALIKSSKLSTKQLIKKLKARSDVLYAAPNLKLKTSAVTNDMTDLQWAIKNTGQNGGNAGVSINAESEWKDNHNTGSKEKVVAIIDTGIDYTHPDLAGNIWENEYQPVLAGEHGYDFSNNDDDPMDDNGHGSHCAGIIGAAADDQGITGICPNVAMMGIKTLDEEGSSETWLELCAYEYISKAQDLGVEVVAVNNSYGAVIPIEDIEGDEALSEEVNSICDICKTAVDTVGAKGAISLMAAGNEGNDVDDGSFINYPACVESDYIISVAASNEKDELADFSNYGESVNVAAPGTDILSTVSYPCYNPGIYDAEEQSACNAQYTDFSSLDENWQEFVSNTQKYISGDDSLTVDVQTTDEEYIGSEPGKSLKLTVHATKAGDIKIRLPEYDAGDLTDIDKQTKKFSMMLKTAATQQDNLAVMYLAVNDEEPEIGFYVCDINYWNHVEMPAVTGDTDVSEPANVTLNMTVPKSGDYTLYIEDYGISKAVLNTELEDTFGKYDYYNGTSMATPYVTGVAALLASAKTVDGTTSYDAYETLDAIYSHLRKGNFDKTTETGSSIDLSKNTPVKITKIGTVAINKDGKAELSGRLLKNVSKIEVKKSGADDAEYKDVDFTVNDDETKAVLPKVADDYLYTNIDFRITYDTDKVIVRNKVYLAPSKAYSKVAGADDTSVWESVVTDGKNLYTLSEGTLSVAELQDNPTLEAEPIYTIYSVDDDDTEDTTAETDSDEVNASVFYRTQTKLGSNMAVVDGKLYVIVNNALTNVALTDDDEIIFSAKSSDGAFYNEYSLMEIDPNKAASDTKYKARTIKLDKSLTYLDDVTLAAYNGKLMFIGGYDYKAKKPTTNVTVYSPTDGKWSAGVAMPDGEGRADGYALQTDSGLVYTMGYSEAQKGVEVAEQKCPANLVYDGKSWKVSSAKLNPSVDPYPATKGSTTYNSYYGSVTYANGGLMYITTPAEGMTDTFRYNVKDDKFTSTAYNMTTKLSKYEILIGAAVGDKVLCQDSDGQIYQFDNKAALLKVKDLSTTGGVVSGANSYVIPGGKVTLKASAKKGYYAKRLVVNGKTAKGKSATIRVSDNKQTAKSVVGKYVTKVKLNKSKITLKAGKTYKLKATVYPKNASNKAVKYTTSNKRYATVTKTGKVKALKAGKGKTVTIKAIAKDGSGKKAVCKVKIK